jgi:predicted ester cyclase
VSTHAARKQAFAEALAGCPPGEAPEALARLLAPRAQVNAYRPVDLCDGAGEARERLFRPLAEALPDLERRDDILLAGSFRGADFVAAAGHHAATFARPLFGIPPTGGLVFLRYGEVHRVEAGAIVESFIHLDLIDLMRQAGVSPLPPSRGAEAIFPAPRGQGGLSLGKAAEEEGAASLALVESMIGGGLARYDRRSLASMGMERYWLDTMSWYGPSGIGATRGLAGFQAHHQRPFLAAFPDRVGGNHKARFGDGMFAVSTGWPSVTATFAGEWLGCPPTGERITMRVMDIWRREGALLAENWVFIDIPDVMAQAGLDVFGRMRALAEAKAA